VILVDTSVWADHYREPLAKLIDLLNREVIIQHPFVTAEMALGNPRNRQAMIAFLGSIDQAVACSTAELLAFVEAKSLWGTGIGFVDAHLLATASRTQRRIWSRDKRLIAQADRLDCLFQP
jgi:predicted nucleic acid-binding protein